MLKLGRRPRTFRPEVPHWSALRMMAKPLAPIPAKKSWLAGMPPDFGMMLNDQLGDCTCAAIYHARQVWSFNGQGTEDTEPDAEVLATYEQACGYVPGDPSTDHGGVEQDVLGYWSNTGIPLADGTRDKLLAWIEIDPRNLDDVRRAIYECGLVYIGFNVPAYLMSGAVPALWDVDPTADNSIVGGHAIVLPGYSVASASFDLVSWGAAYRMTEEFFAAFVDEAYALGDQQWINATGQTPLGLSTAALEAQMKLLG